MRESQKPGFQVLREGTVKAVWVVKKIGKTWDEKQGHDQPNAKEKHSETLLGTARKCPEIERGVCGGLETMVLAHTSCLDDSP